MVNVCTPTFAASQDGLMMLLWSETSDGKNWKLKKSVFDPKSNRWSEAQVIESNGNPRYCSADYDSKGQLWIAYSAQTNKGTEIVVRKL